MGAEEIAVFFAPDKEPEQAAGALVEGATLASYRFNKYRSNSNPATGVKTLTLFKPGLKRTPLWSGR